MCSADKRSGGERDWLNRRDHAHWSHFGRRPSLRERNRERLLKLWFGEEEGRNEILAHQSGPRSSGEVIDEVMSGLGLEWMAVLDRIGEAWQELVGPDIAKCSRPAALYGDRLDIEVSNSSWMYVLETMHKEAIRQRVEEFTDGKVLKVRLVPIGRRGRRS